MAFLRQYREKKLPLPYLKSYLWKTQESKLRATGKQRCYTDVQPPLVIIKQVTSTTTNQHHDQLAKMYSKLKSRGTAAVALLGSLLQDEDDSVACWAATHLLPYQETQAIATLTRVAATSGIIGFTAAITLQEWQAGRLKLN